MTIGAKRLIKLKQVKQRLQIIFVPRQDVKIMNNN